MFQIDFGEPFGCKKCVLYNISSLCQGFLMNAYIHENFVIFPTVSFK